MNLTPLDTAHEKESCSVTSHVTSIGLYGSIYFHLGWMVGRREQETFVHPSTDGFGSCVCLLAPSSSAASSEAV